MKEILITSSVMILAVAALRFLFRSKVSRRLIYGVWLLVALRLLIPIQFGQLDFSVLTQAKPVTDAITDIAQRPVSGPSREELYNNALREEISQGTPVFIPEIQEQVDTQIQQGRPAPEVYGEFLETGKTDEILLPEVSQKIETTVSAKAAPNWGQIALWVWLAGIFVMAGWFLGVNLSLHRALRRSATEFTAECPVPVKVSPRLATPCLFGLLRPTVYLTPACTEDAQRLRHVLTHETTHLRHGDHIWAWVRCLCLCVYWFNPLVWLAAYLSKRDCELACDEAVLKILGESERIAYGRTLVDMVASTPAPGQLLEAATAMHETKKQLKERVNRIVKKPRMFLTAAIALLLVLTIVTGCAFSGAVDPTNNNTTTPTDGTRPTINEALAKINVGQLPLISEPVTLKLFVVCDDNTVSPEDTWMLQCLEQAVGIDIELTYAYSATKYSAFADLRKQGNLPDLIIGMNFTPEELMMYKEDGLLLDMAPYLTEENAPNILAVARQDPSWLRELTNADGEVFSLASWIQPDPDNHVGIFRMFYNYDVMAAAGVTDCPETLDELLNMLRTVKGRFPEMYPFGGNYDRYNPTYLIQNALGFHYSMGGEVANQRSHETDIGLYNGEVTLFSYDRTLLPAYLKFMRTLYAEGLMDPAFYTIDKGTAKDNLKAGKYAIFTEVPGLFGGAEFGQRWWGGMPLTSGLNDTAFWPSSKNYTTGGWCISATTEYPELCVALADLFFSDNDIGRILNNAPSVNDTDYLFGRNGWYYDTEKGVKVNEDYYDPSFSRLPTQTYYLWDSNSFHISFLSYQVDENGNSLRTSLDLGGADVNASAAARREIPGFNGDHVTQFTYALHNTFGKYEATESSPKNFYFDAATATSANSLKQTLDAYARDAIRAFITGETELNDANLEHYFNQMQQLGADTLLQLYTDYWKAVG